MKKCFLFTLAMMMAVVSWGAEGDPVAEPNVESQGSDPVEESTVPAPKIVDAPTQADDVGRKLVYVLPIRAGIDRSMVYLVRRGVKDAMEADADLLVVDMDTNGGRLDSTEAIINSISQFDGETATFVNSKAFSAGAFISVATEKIFMAPLSYIGAAAPIIMAPGGGVQELPSTMEAKTISAVSAIIRAQAEKHGHNPEVIQAMIDKDMRLEISGEVLADKGNLLTLTAVEASKEYVHGEDEAPRSLLSAGTVESIDVLLSTLGYGGARVHRVVPTGAESFASFLVAIGPVLLIFGAVGLYLEFKTPGFGVPGIVGIAAFCLYFFGGYAAGLSGMEWVLIFILGVALVAVELFLFPGTIVIGLTGTAMMFAAVLMALVDLYPSKGPGPSLPTLPSFGDPFGLASRTIFIAVIGGAVAFWILSKLLPKTPLYGKLVLAGTSGSMTEERQLETRNERMGQEGKTVSELHPGGKVLLNGDLVDVTSQGEFVEEGVPVKVVGYRNNVPIVAPVEVTD